MRRLTEDDKMELSVLKDKLLSDLFPQRDKFPSPQVENMSINLPDLINIVEFPDIQPKSSVTPTSQVPVSPVFEFEALLAAHNRRVQEAIDNARKIEEELDKEKIEYGSYKVETMRSSFLARENLFKVVDEDIRPLQTQQMTINQ